MLFLLDLIVNNLKKSSLFYDKNLYLKQSMLISLQTNYIFLIIKIF